MENLIEDYLSEEDKKAIAIEMYRDKVAHYLEDEDTFKRILSNAAYDIVFDMVDKTTNEELKTYLPVKVKEIIENLSSFNLFKRPDAWSRETNSGYQILTQCILDNKEILNNKVRSVLETMSNKQYQFLTKEAIQNIIESSFKK